MKKRTLLHPAALAGTLIMMTACTYDPPQAEVVKDEAKDKAMVEEAVCILHPTEGNSVSGTVHFAKTDSGIYIEADVQGLEPGKHGFHIHQYGDCTDPEGKSAGGHYNPENVEHGGPDDLVRHVGDLGNLEAGEEGMAKYERTDTVIRLNGKHSIIGRAVIVHAGEDDLESQPTGAAGGRLACGVIGIAE